MEDPQATRAKELISFLGMKMSPEDAAKAAKVSMESTIFSLRFTIIAGLFLG